MDCLRAPVSVLQDSVLGHLPTTECHTVCAHHASQHQWISTLQFKFFLLPRITLGIKLRSEMLNSVHACRAAKKFSLTAVQIQLVPVCWESSWFAVWSGLWNIDSKMLAGEIVLRSCPCVWQTENKEEDIRQCCISGLHKPQSSSVCMSETLHQRTSHPQEWQHQLITCCKFTPSFYYL